MRYIETSNLKIQYKATSEALFIRFAKKLSSLVTKNRFNLEVLNIFSCYLPLVGYSASPTPTQHRARFAEIGFNFHQDFRDTLLLYCSASNAFGTTYSCLVSEGSFTTLRSQQRKCHLSSLCDLSTGVPAFRLHRPWSFSRPMSVPFLLRSSQRQLQNLPLSAKL